MSGHWKAFGLSHFIMYYTTVLGRPMMPMSASNDHSFLHQTMFYSSFSTGSAAAAVVSTGGSSSVVAIACSDGNGMTGGL